MHTLAKLSSSVDQAQETRKGPREETLEFLERPREDIAQRIRAGAADEEPQVNQQNRQGELIAAFADVEAVRQMNKKNGPNHDDNDANGSNALEDSRQDSQTPGELCQAHQIADDCRLVQERGKILGAGAAEGSKQDGAAMVENRERDSHTEDKKGKVWRRRPCRGWSACGERSGAHEDLLFCRRRSCSRNPGPEP